MRDTESETVFVDWLREFAESMPPAYRDRHAAGAVTDHARLALGRGSHRVAVGTFRSGRPGMPVCVVADDRPGLLARISAACVVSKLDVMAAEAWCRRVGDRTEAVDLFWLRQASETGDNVWIAPADVATLRSSLVVLLDGTFDTTSLAASLRSRERDWGTAPARVRFVEGEGGTLRAIDVETFDRPGLLFALTDLLFRQRLQIVSSEVRTVGRRVFDRFHIVSEDASLVPAARAPELRREIEDRLRPRRRVSRPPARGQEVTTLVRPPVAAE